MRIANPLWGAPRIHGELLKLGIEIGQTSVAKYMTRRRGPPSQAGALAVIRYAKVHGTGHRPWLTGLLARRPTKVAAIALANKIARIAWAMMARGERYKEPIALAA
jgi:hypothetical protein